MNDTKALLSLLKLRFNIEHPSIEESYAYGYECGSAGVDLEENPFRLRTLEAEHWIEGWWAGFYGETPLFTIEDDIQGQMEQEVGIITAVNDHVFGDSKKEFLIKLLEITSVIGIAAMVGYQVFELVA